MTDIEFMNKADKLIEEVDCMRIDMIWHILMDYKVDDNETCQM